MCPDRDLRSQRRAICWEAPSHGLASLERGDSVTASQTGLADVADLDCEDGYGEAVLGDPAGTIYEISSSGMWDQISRMRRSCDTSATRWIIMLLGIGRPDPLGWGRVI